MAIEHQEEILGDLRWRCIGPPRGGRSIAVAGDPSSPAVFYFGACAGGVWKTYDAGTYWENVSDGFFKTAAVGAIAVAESDPNVVYVGTGEACVRVDGAYGDGVYRSIDAGATWTNVGLRDTRHIARVRVHPHNPDLVYVAALGHAFGRHPDRGVFRSSDGGDSWEKVLHVSDDAGAVDLSIDPSNPHLMYAAMWQMRRRFWDIESGGPYSGLYRSTNGGDTWTLVSTNRGFPTGTLGRIGVAISPAKTGRVWATVEASNSGLYRSDDGGESWKLLTDESDLQGRPWYYQHIFADPKNADTVWVLNYNLWRSIDGGLHFGQVSAPHGDHHDLWIDQRDPRRMIEGADGGASVSLNGGESWSTIYNQLTAQFYRLDTDDRFHYRVYGTQQDNTAISVPSRTNDIAINWTDNYSVGSSESGHIAVQPTNPDVVFSGAIGSSPGGGGNMLRYDHKTGHSRIVTVWPEDYSGAGAKDMRHRFQWTFPILFSPHDPSVLYVAGERVFKTTDEGSSWSSISPDLTRNDGSKMDPSGRPLTREATGSEVYCTIQTLSESTIQQGLLWAGTDDGLIHVSRDGGRKWVDVTPASLEEWTLVSTVEPSHHDPDKAYVAATRYQFDDPRPILMRTTDGGTSWTEIHGGLPAHEYTRVIREDPDQPGLLYVGTELGVHVSLNDGESWQPLGFNLPIVPVHDIKVKGSDLIAGTHGRSLWIMDDLNILRDLAQSGPEMATRLFKPKRAFRLNTPIMRSHPLTGKNYHQLGLGNASTYVVKQTASGHSSRHFLDAGASPPMGVVVHYFLNSAPDAPIELAIADSRGALIQTFTSTPSSGDEGLPEDAILSAEVGLNHFVWDMHHKSARLIPDDLAIANKPTAPAAVPGSYEVRLSVGEKTLTQTFEIAPDPRTDATLSDAEAQFELHRRIRDKLTEVHNAIAELRSVRRQIREWIDRSSAGPGGDTIAKTARELIDELNRAEQKLMKVGFRGGQDRSIIPPVLSSRLAELTEVVAAGDFAPPQQAYDVFVKLSGDTDAQLSDLSRTISNGVTEVTRLLHEHNAPLVTTERSQNV